MVCAKFLFGIVERGVFSNCPKSKTLDNIQTSDKRFPQAGVLFSACKTAPVFVEVTHETQRLKPRQVDTRIRVDKTRDEDAERAL